jgi:hypothetical protein
MFNPAITIGMSIILIGLGIYSIFMFKGITSMWSPVALYFGIAHIGSFFEKKQI